MGGGGVDRHKLSLCGLPATAARGFTLIETMIAMSISIVVLLANLFLFSTAQKNLALSRSVTNATNLATSTFAALKGRSLTQIRATTDNVASGLTLGTHRDDPNVPPVEPAATVDLEKRQVLDGTTFSRTWRVSNVDIDGDGAPELVGDLVKISLVVTWTLSHKSHQVAMATFTTGQSP